MDVDTLMVNDSYKAEVIISTIPWPEIRKAAMLSDRICSVISELESASITVEYQPDSFGSNAHWVYEPDENISYHRILCRHNFVPGSRGCWTETNTKRSTASSNWMHINKYAYPINTVNKPSAIKEITDWFRQVGIVGIGRWGTWEHMNSDVAVAAAREKAKELMGSI
jgi:protoporphyrinogen oxidase